MDNKNDYFEFISQTEEFRDKIIRDLLEEEEYLNYNEAEIIVELPKEIENENIILENRERQDKLV